MATSSCPSQWCVAKCARLCCFRCEGATSPQAF
jgi:hypothetical protein